MKIKEIISPILIIYFFLVQSSVNADDSDTITEIQDTNCEKLLFSENEYEITYEERMEISNMQFESSINKNEQACDSRFKTITSNTSSGGSSGSSGSAGSSGSGSSEGDISGTQVLNDDDLSETASASVSSNSPLTENNSPSSQINGGSTILENGKIPECIRNISGDDEFAAELKETIGLVTDKDQKKELIKAYSDYKGLNIDENEC